jgi:glycerophosphoryl diester phosphodiesterase
MFKLLSLYGLINLSSALISDAPYMTNSTKPLVICHRGAAGRHPEHSLAAEDDCFFQNADFIELDIHTTKDGHLIVNHEPCMKDTLNVEQYSWKFGDRMRSMDFPLYHDNYTDDFFFADFTLAEIKMFTRKQRYGTMRQNAENFIYPVLTVEEALDNLLMLNKNFPRNKEYPTGLYIETKMYWWYKQEYGINIIEKLHQLLESRGLGDVKAATQKLPIVI